MTPQLQNILKELRQRLEELYGERLEKLVLFGSQARGDAELDSDIDVMIVLKGEVNRSEERRKVIPITAEISLQNNVVISCIYVSSKRYVEDDEPVLINARREGLPL